MLSTVLAATLLQQPDPVVTYVTTDSHKIPTYIPEAMIEGAKKAPSTFEFRGQTWEVAWIDNEYIAINIDATEIEPLRKFRPRLEEITTQFTHEKPYAIFDLKKDCPLSLITLWPSQLNTDQHVGNASISLEIEGEIADRDSNVTGTFSGSTYRRLEKPSASANWPKISEFELNKETLMTFNPQWSITVRSSGPTRNQELIRARQLKATEYFWRTYDQARADARAGYDSFINRLQRNNTPLSFWSQEFVGKNFSEIPTEIRRTVNESYKPTGNVITVAKTPYVKSIRIWLCVASETMSPDGNIESGARVMIDRP